MTNVNSSTAGFEVAAQTSLPSLIVPNIGKTKPIYSPAIRSTNKTSVQSSGPLTSPVNIFRTSQPVNTNVSIPSNNKSAVINLVHNPASLSDVNNTIASNILDSESKPKPVIKPMFNKNEIVPPSSRPLSPRDTTKIEIHGKELHRSSIPSIDIATTTDNDDDRRKQIDNMLNQQQGDPVPPALEVIIKPTPPIAKVDISSPVITPPDKIDKVTDNTIINPAPPTTSVKPLQRHRKPLPTVNQPTIHVPVSPISPKMVRSPVRSSSMIPISPITSPTRTGPRSVSITRINVPKSPKVGLSSPSVGLSSPSVGLVSPKLNIAPPSSPVNIPSTISNSIPPPVSNNNITSTTNNTSSISTNNITSTTNNTSSISTNNIQHSVINTSPRSSNTIPPPASRNNISSSTSNNIPPPASSNSIPSPVSSNNIPPPASSNNISPPASSNNISSSTSNNIPPPASRNNISSSTSNNIPPPVSSNSIPPPVSSNSIPPPASSNTIPPPASSNTIPPPASSNTIPPPASRNNIPPPASSNNIFSSTSSNNISSSTSSNNISSSTSNNNIPPPASSNNIPPPASSNNIPPPASRNNISSSTSNNIPPPASKVNNSPEPIYGIGLSTDDEPIPSDIKEEEPDEVKPEQQITPQPAELPKVNVPEYSSMSSAEQAQHRANFRTRFGILRNAWPNYFIPDVADDLPLEDVHAQYDIYVRHIHISQEVDQYKVYLVIMWLIIELACIKLGLNAGGYTMAQMGTMNKYERLLIELGENSHKSTESSGSGGMQSSWPVEVRILFIALVNAVTFIIIKMLSSYLGDGMANMIVDGLSSYLSGSPAQPGPTLFGSNPSTSTSQPQVQQQGPAPGGQPLPQMEQGLGGIFGGMDVSSLIASVGSSFLNGNGFSLPGMGAPAASGPAVMPVGGNTAPAPTTPKYRPAYTE